MKRVVCDVTSPPLPFPFGTLLLYGCLEAELSTSLRDEVSYAEIRVKERKCFSHQWYVCTPTPPLPLTPHNKASMMKYYLDVNFTVHFRERKTMQITPCCLPSDRATSHFTMQSETNMLEGHTLIRYFRFDLAPYYCIAKPPLAHMSRVTPVEEP